MEQRVCAVRPASSGAQGRKEVGEDFVRLSVERAAGLCECWSGRAVALAIESPSERIDGTTGSIAYEVTGVAMETAVGRL
jgi:hypothetical protein